MPNIGDILTVELAGERTRAEVLRIVSPTAVIARINQFTVQMKSHPYKKDDIIAARLGKDFLGFPAWVAVPESEINPPAGKSTEEPAMREAVEGDILAPQTKATVQRRGDKRKAATHAK